MLLNPGSTWEDDDEPKKKELIPVKDAFHQQVYDMWEAGIRDLMEIRNETGYTTRYIRQLLRDRGYDVQTTIPRSVEDMNKIVQDYRTMSVRAVLKKWNISNNTLYSILDARNEPIKRRNNKVRAAHMDQAVKMYLAREPLKAIVNETGVHAPALYEELALRDIILRFHDAKTNEPLQRAVEMYNMGSKIYDIMAETGVTLTTLYKTLSDRGTIKRRGSDFDKRLAQAIDLYMEKKPMAHIYQETKINAPVLYRGLRERGIPVRQSKAQGDLELAIRMYDQGSPFREINRTAKVTFSELLNALRKRGGKLRTGLTTSVTPQHIQLAVKMYQANASIEDIELDTFVSRPMLYADLKRKNIVIRP